MAPDDAPAIAANTPPRSRRWPRVLAGLALALGLVGAAGYAWLGTDSALRFVLGRATAASEGRLTFEGAEGSLLSIVQVARIDWRGDDVDIGAREVSMAWSPFDLVSRRFTVAGLAARQIAVTVRTAADSTSGLPATLALPLEVNIRNVGVQSLTWTTPKGSGALTGIAFSYAGGATSHRLADLRFVTPDGTLSGGAEVGAAAPFPLRGELEFAGDADWKGALATVKVAGPLERLDLDARGTLRDAKVAARIVATPFAAVPLVSADIDASAVNIAQWDAAWPATDLTLKLVARPDGDGFTGTVEARNAQAGPLDAGRIPAESLAARFAWRDGSLALSDAEVAIAGGGGASGRVTIPTRGGASEWALQLRDVNLARIQSTLLVTRLSGGLTAEVTGSRQSVRGDLREDARALTFAAVVEGRRVRIESFRAQAAGGELAGQGTLALDGTRPFSVNARAAKFDPSRFADVPSALLTGTVEATGTLAPVWDVVASVTLDAGSKLADIAVSGKARGRVTPGRATDLDATIKAASATATLKGAWGTLADKLQFALDAPRVGELRPLMLRATPQWPDGLAGAVKLSGALSGAPRNPGLVLEAHGQSLQWGRALRAATLNITATVAPGSETSAAFDKRALQIVANGTSLSTPQGELKLARVKVTGTLAQHDGAITAAGDGFNVAAGFAGGLEDRKPADGKPELAWSGKVSQLTNTGSVPLALEAPATLMVSRARVELGTARIAIAEGRADIERLIVDAGRVDTRGSFSAVPVTAVARLTGIKLPIASTVILGGDWNVTAAPKLNGTFNVKRESGDLFAAESASLDVSELALGITALDLAGRFVDDALDATARFRSSRGGSAEATFALAAGNVPGTLSIDAAMRATLRADMTTLRPLQPWLGTTAVVDGRAHIDIEARGTLAQPTYGGTLTADALRFAVPQYGVQLQDGRLRARLSDRTIILDELSLVGGEGRFVAEGTLAQARDEAAATVTNRAKIEVRWRAEKFTVVNRPDLQIVADGNGTLALQDKRLALSGTVDIVKGTVTYAATVDGRLSSDVVIVGRPRPTADADGMGDVPLSLDLDVGFGSNFRFSGDGLETRLEGRVRLTNNAAGVLFANGTIRAVEGTYYVFGQRLVIDRGNLIFNGRADNPGLDVVALRKNLAVEAGVEVQGTVRVPRVRLVSNPPVPDGEKLSWLITGQGLDRASTADLAALSAASASLLTGTERPLTTQIANRLGLDDITFRGTGTTTTGGTSGQVVALGKRISDRLSIVYEQGLTVATNALRIEYALTQTLTVRAEAGTVSSIGIFFRRTYN
jgi:translocation and assembly module TamB